MSQKQRDDTWPQRLDLAIKRKFGVATETFYDLIGTMRYVTVPKDKTTPLTDKIHTFIADWMKREANRP